VSSVEARLARIEEALTPRQPVELERRSPLEIGRRIAFVLHKALHGRVTEAEGELVVKLSQAFDPEHPERLLALTQASERARKAATADSFRQSLQARAHQQATAKPGPAHGVGHGLVRPSEQELDEACRRERERMNDVIFLGERAP